MIKKLIQNTSARNITLILSILLLHAALVFSTVYVGIPIGSSVVIFLIFVIYVIISVTNPHISYLIVIIVSSTIFLLPRLLPFPLPLGVIAEGVLYPPLLALLFRSKSVFKDFFQSNITIFYSIFFIYCFLQIANPYGVPMAWLTGFRKEYQYVMMFIISWGIFNKFSDIKIILSFWFIVALFIALYAYYQQLVGLPDFDMKWVTADEMRAKLHFINYKWRKWSILANSTNFGIFIAYFGVLFLLLAVSIRTKPGKRILIILSSLLMIGSVSYSGTRTAYALIPIAISLYILLTIHKRSTLVLSFVFSIAFIAILYGPFYSGPIKRIRSTFNPSEDGSFNVRENANKRIQPYILSHPIGAGLGVVDTREISHPMNGYPSDNIYLRTGIELGWIGIILRTLLFFIVVRQGVLVYFKLKNSQLKATIIATLCPTFALMICGYTQSQITLIPLGVIFFSLFALFSKANKFEDDDGNLIL